MIGTYSNQIKNRFASEMSSTDASDRCKQDSQFLLITPTLWCGGTVTVIAFLPHDICYGVTIVNSLVSQICLHVACECLAHKTSPIVHNYNYAVAMTYQMDINHRPEPLLEWTRLCSENAEATYEWTSEGLLYLSMFAWALSVLFWFMPSDI